MTDRPDPDLPAISGSRPVRAAFAVLGTLALGLALVGIVLPVLPTTPFLLLAAACYARASTRLHRWLMGQQTLGPIIERWQRSRSMAKAVKVRAMLVTVTTFAISIIVVGNPAPAVVLAATGAVVLAFLARIPTDG
jgi:uncharacterized membrane protein YbaN (DUF454 family)